MIPAIIPVKSTIAFGDVSAVVLDKHEKTCALALELLHTALQKPSILRAMEAEWRREHVAPRFVKLTWFIGVVVSSADVRQLSNP